MPEPVPLFRHYTREQIVEALRLGDIEPNVPSIMEKGRSRQQARVDLQHFQSSGGKVGRQLKRQPRQVEREVVKDESSRETHTPVIVTPNPPEPLRRRIPWAKIGWGLLATLLIGLACAIAFVNGWLSWRYNSSFGIDQLSGTPQALIAGAAEALAMTLPTIAWIVWNKGYKFQAICCALLAAACVWMAIVATTGFMNRNLGDTKVKLSKIMTEKERLTDRLAAAVREHERLGGSDNPLILEGQIQLAQSKCQRRKWSICDEATRLTILRDNAVDRLELPKQLNALKDVASASPSGDLINSWSWGWMNQGRTEGSWIMCLVVLANMGPGILNMAAMALLKPTVRKTIAGAP